MGYKEDLAKVTNELKGTEFVFIKLTGIKEYLENKIKEEDGSKEEPTKVEEVK